MEQLLKDAKIDFSNKRPKDIAERLQRVYETASLSKRTNELNRGFVFFKRWISMVEFVKKSKPYRENPAFYAAYINNKQIEEAKASLAEIEKKLIAQFAPKMPRTEENNVIDASSKNGTQKTTDGALNLPETPTDEPLALEKQEFLTCPELFGLMRGNERWLIIDTRPVEDYDGSRITTDRCVNIPEDKIKPGLLASSFEKLLSNDKDSYRLFKQRSAQNCDSVILLDWNSTKNTLFPENRVRVLKDILQSWDHNVKPAKIMILDGGFKDWLISYPAFVTNPNVKTPKAPDIEMDAMDEIFDDYDYLLLNADNNSSPLNSLRIQTKNTKPKIPEQTLSEVITDRLKKDDGNSQYNKISTNNRKDETNVLGNKNETIRNPYDLVNKKTSEMSRLIRKFEDAEGMNTDEDEIVPFTTNHANKTLINDSTPKPKIDRSSKPSSLKNQYDNYREFLALKEQLREFVKIQERIENQIWSNEREGHEQIDDDPNLVDVLKENQRGHLDKLNAVNEKKAAVVNVLATIKIDESSMSPQDKKEKDRIDLEIEGIEQRRKTISAERKKLQEKIQSGLHKKDSSIRNENVHKEPLKSDGLSANNQGLKRSHSSPNLAQQPKHLDDRKIPQVDRTSKPHVPVPQNANRAKTSLNNKYTSPVWKDRLDRMEPVFRTVHPGITGLKNLGNSCYMNSIIQCLSNTAHLAKYFNDSSYIADLNTTNNNSVQGQVAEEVAQVIRALWRGQYKSISPRDLKVVIGQYKLQFNSYDQQDSHEFLTFLLDWMHDDLKKPVKRSISSSQTPADKEWDKAMESQQSIISHLFFGQLRSSIICKTCGKSSVTYETFNSLTMTINDSKSCTLDQCVQKYVTGQTISDWKCAHCKVPREATKKFDFVKLAPIIVIHLNRFGDTDGWLRKQDTPVDFPLTGFDLKPYLAAETELRHEQPNNYRYSLYAMSNHYGTMEGGHYTAYCKSATQNKWYKYDDQTVTEVMQNSVKSGNTTSAYLLFYTSLPNEPSGYR